MRSPFTRPGGQRLLLATATALLLAVALHSQRSAVPVRALLQPPTGEAVTEWPLGELGEYSAIEGELRSWHILGQQRFLRISLPLLSPDMVTTLLANRLDLPKDELTVTEGLLLVARNDRAAVSGAVRDLTRRMESELVELELRLERKRGTEWAVLSSGIGLSRGGSLVQITDIVRRNKTIDFGVEVAQSAAIGDPEIQAFADGAAIFARARSVPGTTLAVLELMAGDHELESGHELDLGSEQLGSVDRIVANESRIAFATTLEQGKTSRHEWTDAAGRQLRLSVRGTWTPVRLADAGTTLLSSLLVRRRQRLRLAPGDPRRGRGAGLPSAAAGADPDGDRRRPAAFVAHGLLVSRRRGAARAALPRARRTPARQPHGGARAAHGHLRTRTRPGGVQGWHPSSRRERRCPKARGA